MMTKKLGIRIFFPLLVALFLGACQAVEVQPLSQHPSVHGKALVDGTQDAARRETGNIPVLDLRENPALKQIIPLLAEKRVVYVGETHDQYSHHLTQLEIIRELYRLHPGMAIGLEFFQQPYQSVLDRYIQGDLEEGPMLVDSEWYKRWVYDYRLYRPILNFAREKGIPLLALNVPRELTQRVSRKGLTGLTREERARLPAEIDTSDQVYRKRLKQIFSRHANSSRRSFERFMEVQLVWDEGMAERVTDYLQANPQRRMVVLAGSGHLMFGSGIPQRVNRRLPVSSAIVLPGDRLELAPGIADFITYPGEERLPPAGVMGIYLGQREQGVLVDGLSPGGAAERVGLKKGDLIQSLDGREIHQVADIRVALLDKSPGDQVKLKVLRKGVVWGEDDLAFDMTLGE